MLRNVTVCALTSPRLDDNNHNRTERDSQGVGRDILISKKVIFRTMRTTRKQCALTSPRLDDFSDIVTNIR